ncbi:NUDIX domain-containing protein [Kitasatospora sp. NPDC051914]|uniref:NUDIX domain-containing protein n=1 Tax=Kitasatospora sp. NPDC051914 TaxID=3154945 RepID=UPI003443FBB4
MSVQPAAAANPAVVVRTCAVLLEGRDVCLIHRVRPGGDQFSLPGGLLDPAEHVPEGLARELREELGLDVAGLPEQPQLRWVQDQANTRPGREGIFRRLHLVHVLRVPPHVRQTVAATEQDAEDRNRVLWLDLEQAATLHLYPAVGSVLGSLAGPEDAPGPVLLPPITDRTFTWR